MMTKHYAIPALVYSKNQMIRRTFEHICLMKRLDQIVLSTDNLYNLELMINKYRPKYLLLDIVPRLSANFINHIRLSHPDLPIVVVQNSFLYSDRIVAEYFGFTFLREYQALLDAFPHYTADVLFDSPEFAGPYYYSTQCKGGRSASEDINQWLKSRIQCVVSSQKALEITFNWLVHGISPKCVAREANLSDKVIYSYHECFSYF